MSKTRLMTAVALASAGVVLTGCGSAAPGVAATVGDESISIKRVDEAAANFCAALEEQISGQGAVVPMNYVRQSTVQLLTVRSMAEQIAEAYDVRPGAGYRQAVAQQEPLTEQMPEGSREDYLELATANDLASDILEQVGAIELEKAGVANPTPEQVGQAGVDVFQVWPDVHGIEVDPRFGLENVDGQLRPVDTSLSTAVSKDAVAAMADEPDVTYAKSLPVGHRCG